MQILFFVISILLGIFVGYKFYQSRIAKGHRKVPSGFWAFAAGFIVLCGVTIFFNLVLFGQGNQGDGNLTLKMAQPITDSFMVGEELSTTLPIANHHLGTNKANQTINVIASNDFSGFHSDVNVNLTRFGDDQGSGVSQQSFGWSAGISHPLINKISGGLELSGTQQHGVDSTLQTLESLGYSFTNKTVFDIFTAQQKIGSNSHNYSFGFGVTHLFAE
ncbi:MAG: hypothetical protein NVS3B3_05190 [Aquirhabdus sp.]